MSRALGPPRWTLVQKMVNFIVVSQCWAGRRVQVIDYEVCAPVLIEATWCALMALCKFAEPPLIGYLLPK